MENIKELFAEWGLWSLVEDISDDGDGTGDNLQLTKEGSEAQRMIEQELDKARGELLANIMGFVHNSKNSREDIKGYIGELYVDNKYDVVHGLRMPVRESELDKLKDNK